MARTHTPLSSACPTAIHPPHTHPVWLSPTASLAPWPARSSPPFASLPPQRRRSCTSALCLRHQRSTPLPPLRGRRGLAYPVRVFFNTTPGCRGRLPDERCRPVWTNRPPPSGEDRCLYPAGTVSSHFSELARGTHTHTAHTQYITHQAPSFQCIPQTRCSASDEKKNGWCHRPPPDNRTEK